MADQRVLDTAYRVALQYIAGLDARRVAPAASYETLCASLGGSLPFTGVTAERVINDLATAVEDGLMTSAGGRFFGWVRGGALPVAVAADWLTSVWDQNAALYTTGPAAAVVEEVVGAWLKELLGLPARASFAIVTGCQMANVTCLAAARHRLLAGHGWDTEQDGLFGAPPIRVLAVGRSQIVELTSDAEGRIDQNACEDALTRGQDAPTVLILQAGDVNIGACDEFTALIPCAKRLGAWVHVDGAFGLWAATSPRLKALVAGVAAADSWATDGHKWLNVPYDCGYAFVADPDAHSAAMSHRATYLVHDVGGRDSIDWNPEWSRRARCFSTYAALRHLGRTGVGELVERCCRHARDIAEGIGELAGAELLWRPTLNQGLVRFLCPRPSATQEDHDRFTDDAIAAIAAQGEAFFSGTSWRGRRAMRISVCSWRTGSDDVRRTVASVRATLADLREHELSQ